MSVPLPVSEKISSLSQAEAAAAATGRLAALPRILGEDVAATAFLNALLREWAGWRHVPDAGQDGAVEDGHGDGMIVLPLDRARQSVLVPLRHFSISGRHSFRFPLLVRDDAWARPKPIAFAELVRLVLTEPSIAGETSPADSRCFRDRVATSTANIVRAIEVREGRDEGSATPDGETDFIRAEQALLGHPVHPAPRSCDEFSDADMRLYAPEYDAAFSLHWFAVHRDAVLSATVGSTADAITRHLAGDDPRLGAGFPDRVLPSPDFMLMPMHPWQASTLADGPVMAGLRDSGAVIDLGPGGSEYRPTSSTRTVWAGHARHMIKFSLSVRVTNSERVLQPVDADRGKFVARFLASAPGQALAAECPSLRIMAEPAHLMLKDGSGAPFWPSAMIFRDNPFRGAAGGRAFAMGTLCQEGYDGCDSLIARLIRGIAGRRTLDEGQAALLWFDRFLDIAVKPCLIAQANYGLLFSAHQQNTVMEVDDDGLPRIFHFRDCQGTAFSETAAVPMEDLVRGEVTPPLVMPDDLTHRLFAYYFIVNNVFNVISAIGIAGLADERALHGRLRRFLTDVRRSTLKDSGFADYLLASPTLACKGNFHTFLGGIDETAAAGSILAAYVDIDNPIAHIKEG